MLYYAIGFVIIILLFKGIAKMQQQHLFLKEIIFFLLVIFSGLRYNVGVDYPVYEDIYNDPYSVHTFAIEPIWLEINNILRILGFKARGFFFLTSFIIVWGYCRGIRKMSPDFYVSILLFFVCGFYFESTNIIRQYIATSVLFAGFTYFLQAKLKIFFCYAFMAILFHYSALLILPIIFLSKFKYPVVFWGGMLLFSFAYGSYLMNLIIEHVMPSLAVISSYRYDVDDFDSGVSSGLLQIFYNLLGLLLLFFYSRLQKRDTCMSVLLNMTLIGIVCYNTFYLFMPARRLYLYFFPYLIVLFPCYLKGFTPVSRWIIVGVIVSIFLAFLLKSNWMTHYDFDFLFF